MNLYAFEKLEVWRLEKELVILIYQITRDFPDEEKYGLVSQIRRAAVSVCSNTAEGSARWGPMDQARFYEMAYSSLVEVVSHLHIAHDLGYILKEILDQARGLIEQISRMLNGLYRAASRSKH